MKLIKKHHLLHYFLIFSHFTIPFKPCSGGTLNPDTSAERHPLPYRMTRNWPPWGLLLRTVNPHVELYRLLYSFSYYLQFNDQMEISLTGTKTLPPSPRVALHAESVSPGVLEIYRSVISCCSFSKNHPSECLCNVGVLFYDCYISGLPIRLLLCGWYILLSTLIDCVKTIMTR